MIFYNNKLYQLYLNCLELRQLYFGNNKDTFTSQEKAEINILDRKISERIKDIFQIEAKFVLKDQAVFLDYHGKPQLIVKDTVCEVVGPTTFKLEAIKNQQKELYYDTVEVKVNNDLYYFNLTDFMHLPQFGNIGNFIHSIKLI